MREIFDISVYIGDIDETITKAKTVKMIPFTGKCKSQYFVGEIMPGAMDVQIVEKDGKGTVSARYVIKGIDSSLIPCKVYIENTGIIEQNGEMRTTPKIVTDSEDLEWLQTAELHCGFAMEDDVFHVKIYSED
jgi:hypothetical protein